MRRLIRQIGLHLGRLIAVGGMALAVPAVAQGPTPVGMEPGKSWTHAPSGFVFPAAIKEYSRDAGMRYAQGDADISAEYISPTRDGSISVYIYQAAIPNPGILIAEARTALEQRATHYQNLKPLDPIASFAPPGGTVKSGLRLTYRSEGRFTSTAVAVAPLGKEWAVKFRVSSMTASAEQLDTLLSTAIAALEWPGDRSGHVEAAVPVACTASLPDLPRTNAAKVGQQYSILAGFVASTSGGKSVGKDGAVLPPARYCRDSKVPAFGTLYRPEDATDSYTIAVGDSGRAILVRPDPAATALANQEKKPALKSIYAVHLIMPGILIIYPPQDAMPSPDQALQIVMSGKPVATVDRNADSARINISPP